MEGHKSTVYKKLLSLCMGDNYTDATVVFREYIQNAIDAIYQAEELGIISKTDNYVSVDTNSSDVCIMDRGIGVKKSNIGETLVDIGNSNKTHNEIGKYGIGRLSGANWCDKIIFETSYKGEPSCSILSFDAKLAREIVNDNTSKDLASVMDEVTSFESKPERDEELRDEDTIRNYLSFIAPIPYDDNFYDDCQKKSFLKHPDFKELNQKEKICKLHLNGKPIVKPYRSTIYKDSKTLKITPPSFFKIVDEDFGDLAWGWYSINELAQQMGEGVNYKGLRLRAKNMAVGSQDYLIDCFKNPTDANYVIGEVFIINNKIQPTGSRDGIIPSKEYNELIIRLKKKFKEIRNVYDAMSKLGSQALNPIIKAREIIDKTKNEIKTSDINDEDKVKLQAIIKEQKETIEKGKSEISTKIKAVDEAENTELLKELIVKHWVKEAQKQASSHNAKVKPEHKIEPVNVESIIASVVNNERNSEDDSKELSNKPSYPSSEKEKRIVEPKETDVFKILGSAEYKLMKKVYQVINAEKRLDDITKKKIKSHLAKKILS